jgi:hypothetical protein
MKQTALGVHEVREEGHENLVWDHLHQYQTPTPLADVDVIFFDPQDVRPERDRMVQQQLAQKPTTCATRLLKS